MSERDAKFDMTEGHGVAYTLDLTRAFQDGEISADDYVSKRADRVGRSNLIHGVFVPFYEAFRHGFRKDGISDT